MKLIDLDALEAFHIRADHYDRQHGNPHFISGIETVIEYAESLPEAVVRCKDCSRMNNEFGSILCEKFNRFTSETFFCSDGERRKP